MFVYRDRQPARVSMPIIINNANLHIFQSHTLYMHLSPVVTHTLDTKFNIHRIIAGSFQRGREREKKRKSLMHKMSQIFFLPSMHSQPLEWVIKCTKARSRLILPTTMSQDDGGKSDDSRKWILDKRLKEMPWAAISHWKIIGLN